MPDDEARALLHEPAVHATQEKYRLSVAYGVGYVVIRDNASLLHSAALTDAASAHAVADHGQGADPGRACCRRAAATFG
jgi:hypothetical protein